MSIGFAVPINCVSLCVGLCICLFGMQRQSEKKLYSRDHTGGQRQHRLGCESTGEGWQLPLGYLLV